MQTAGRNIANVLTTLCKACGRSTRGFVLDVMLSLVIYGLAVPATYLAGAIVYTPTAVAQSYGAGYQKYQKGDFQGAKAAFAAALKKQPGKAEAARILKYLGVSQFMLGDQSGAIASFKRALRINPALALTNAEVLDDSVLPVFARAKGKKSAGPAPAAPTAARPVAAPRPAAAGQAKLAGGKPLKQTFLKVLSNVATAQVFVDGIIAGAVNELINTDPGSVLVEVQARGFITRKVNVSIAPNAENKITVNLDKPKPRPKPVAKKPRPKPQQKLAKKNGQGKKGFGGNLYTPTPDDGMFEDDGGGQSGGAGGDLAGEFAMDAAGGPPPGYGAPQGYGAPPAYGAPQGYGAPPGYAAPPAYGYAPPPPAYGYGYAPPPPAYGGGYGYAPPPPPPDSGYGDPYGAQPAAAIPADPAGGGSGAPAAAGASGDEDAEASGNTDGLFIKLLPFGAGQFYNGSFMLGLLFAGAEAGAIYVYMSKTSSANDAAAATNAYITANKENTAIQENEEEKAKYDKFIADSKLFVDGERKTAMFGMIGFGALWGVGAIESILNGKPKKVKKKKKRKYSPFGVMGTPSNDLTYSVLAELPENRSLYAFDWQLSVVPAYDGYDLTTSTPAAYSPETVIEPALKVGVKLSF